MESKIKVIWLASFFLIAGKSLYAQSGEQRFYAGPGFGLDYGGFGAKCIRTTNNNRNIRFEHITNKNH
jgi:hypothetical protein